MLIMMWIDAKSLDFFLCVFLCLQVFLIFCMTITMIFAKEVPYRGNVNLPTKANGEVEVEPTGPLAVFKGFKNLPPGMPSVLLVTGLTWVRCTVQIHVASLH
jgi:solute carrier family 45 protein 1/2/4